MSDLWTEGLDRPNRNETKKVPFLSLKDYNTSWRVRNVSEQPLSYDCHFTTNASGQMSKVNCSQDAACPVMIEKSGTECGGTQPQKRFYITVLDRADGVIKVLDVGRSIVNSIGLLHKNPDWGNSKEYDITITKGPRGTQPASLFSVAPSPKKPLTPEELALVENSVNGDHPDFIDIEPRQAPLAADVISKILGLTPKAEEKKEEETSETKDGDFGVDWDSE